MENETKDVSTNTDPCIIIEGIYIYVNFELKTLV